MRGSDVYDLPIGTILTDTNNTEHIFIGWRQNTRGLEAWFVRALHKDPIYLTPDTLRTYKATFAPTLAKRFPGIERYRIPE